MTRSTLIRNLLVFSTSVVVVVVGILLALTHLRRREAHEHMERANATAAAFQRVLYHLQSAEASQREYIITGNGGLLRRYTAAAAAANNALLTVDSLSDTRAERALARHLRELADAKIQLSNGTIDIRRTVGADSARSLIASGRGRAITDAIRSVVAQVNAGKNNVLAEFAGVEQRHADMLAWIIILGTVISAGGALSSGVVLGRYAESSDRDARDLAMAVEILESQKAELQAQARAVAHSTAELERSEARFRALVENASDIVTVINAEGIITYESPAVQRVLGYTPEERVGRHAFDVLHPDDRPRVKRDFAALLRQPGAVEGGESRLRHKNGEWRPVQGTVQNLLDHPAVEGFVINSRDLSAEKRAEQAAREQLERLRALRAIDLAITGSLDLRTSLSVVLDHSVTRLGVDAADVLLLEPEEAVLEFAAGRGFRTKSIHWTRSRLDDFVFASVVLKRRTLVVHDLSTKSEFLRTRGIEKEDFVAYVGVPLVAKGQVRGVLEVFSRVALPADPDWLAFLEALAGQAAIAIDNARLFEELQLTNEQLILAYDRTLEGWVRALDLRDKETEGHSRRVTEGAVALGRELGLNRSELADLRRGALLHDVGKLGVPDHILLKPSPLSEEEWEIMRRHPVYAHEWLAPIPFLRKALDVPYAHHERWDGSGYPRGLKGDMIPLAARIFAVIDVWDALRFDRPYRKGWSDEQVREHLENEAGILYDPVVVQAFLDLLQD